MTDRELKVAVAKDVLTRVVANPDVHIETLGYLETNRVGDVCEVCAVGAMVASALGNSDLRQQFNVEPFFSAEDASETHAFKKFVDETLARVFGKEQLGLIEAAFEGYTSGWWANAKLPSGDTPDNLRDEHLERLDEDSQRRYRALRRAVRFGDAVDRANLMDNDTARLRLAAIFENVIDNEGVFIP